jgi:hypothetical protein
MFTGAASLVEVDDFGDASSPCKIAAEPFVLLCLQTKLGQGEVFR